MITTFVSSPNSQFTVRLHVERARSSTIRAQGREERIRNTFKKIEISVSPYDTAWIAMVPSLDSPRQPCFPECLNWLLENQLQDGSWSLPCRHPLLIKDSMLSTLACVLALRQWEVGDGHVRKGLEFMESNFGATLDKNQLSPIGFDMIFPSLIEYAYELGLKFPLNPNNVETMLRRRDLEFDRASRSNSRADKAYLAYIYEGLAKLYDCTEVMKYQRKNGSLFNSPSTTAAVLIQNRDFKCYEYLRSILKEFGHAAPTVYPTEVYINLYMVDCLQRLGIGRQFRDEIKNLLDKTYRCWIQNDEDIFLDMETCALAFRLLRTNGYEVSSDALARFEEQYLGSGHLDRMESILELYKASQLMIYSNEPALEMVHSWTSHILKQNHNVASLRDKLQDEVDHALKFTWDVGVERLETRRNIECYDVDNVRILKTSYMFTNFDNKAFLLLAVEDYNYCQVIHQKELMYLERWIKENRLDQLKFARQKLSYAYFSIACILSTPELSDARISWTKNVVLTTVVDDFFDIGGSREELESLIDLVERWDRNSTTNYSSEQVGIIFLTLQRTINELGALAEIRQGRSVKVQIIDLWLTLLKSMMREYEWAIDKSAPMMDEYLDNARISFALGPVVLITLYFLGPKLSQDMITSSEYSNLFNHLNICGRLCNDIQSFKREGKEGKLNSVLLYMIHGSGVVTEEDAVKVIRTSVDQRKRELLSLVLQTKGSVVPKACKDLFWKTNTVIQLFYKKTDGFSSPLEMISAVNAVLHEPIEPPCSTLSKDALNSYVGAK